jgi:hypothetical protein
MVGDDGTLSRMDQWQYGQLFWSGINMDQGRGRYRRPLEHEMHPPVKPKAAPDVFLLSMNSAARAGSPRSVAVGTPDSCCNRLRPGSSGQSVTSGDWAAVALAELYCSLGAACSPPTAWSVTSAGSAIAGP